MPKYGFERLTLKEPLARVVGLLDSNVWGGSDPMLAEPEPPTQHRQLYIYGSGLRALVPAGRFISRHRVGCDIARLAPGAKVSLKMECCCLDPGGTAPSVGDVVGPY